MALPMLALVVILPASQSEILITTAIRISPLPTRTQGQSPFVSEMEWATLPALPKSPFN